MSLEPTERISRALQAQLVNAILGNERIARRFSLHVTDFQTLHLLVLRPDVRTPRQVSAVGGLPTSTVTSVLDRLENAGYLRRSNDPTDRRRIRIDLVEERIAPILEYMTTLTQAHDVINDEFTDEELGTVARYLERISGFFEP